MRAEGTSSTISMELETQEVSHILQVAHMSLQSIPVSPVKYLTQNELARHSGV
jgi:hypothetical protein